MYRANSIFDEIKDAFKKGSSLTRLIYINLAFYAIIIITLLVFTLSGLKEYYNKYFLDYLVASSDLSILIRRPWTIFTYMFSHFRFFHIFFNMLVLFWFGRIFLRYLNQKQLLTTYFIGGFTGLILFLASYNIFPGLLVGSTILGASAAIMAIVFAISFYAPDFTIHLLFIGPVKIKIVAIVYIAIDIIMIAYDQNAGGYISHVGGALYGYLYATQLKKGKDIAKGFSSVMDSISGLFRRKSKMKVTYKSAATRTDDFDYNKSKADNQNEIDRILDKIAKSGYDSLTRREKETLFKMGNKS